MTERVIAVRGVISPDYRCKGIAMGKRMHYSGKVRIARRLEEARKSFEKGDILVIEHERIFNPDWVAPIIKKAGAVILDKTRDGEPSNLSNLCRELGIPYIAQTGNATRVLEDGEEYTIEPTGAIYETGNLRYQVQYLKVGLNRFFSGKVKLVHSLNEAAKSIQRGDILVTEDISEKESPEWMPVIKEATAVVLDKNVPESNLGTACRRLGIPFVTQTGNATQVLKNGQEYTIDTKTGTIYKATARWDD